MRGRIALIACANGYGHVERQARLAVALAGRGQQVTLLAPRAAAERALARSPLRDGVVIHDFDTMTSAAKLRDGAPEASSWEERLPDLDAYDCVVSDNLPETLARRSDATLMGNFLWHEVLEGCDPGYVARARGLLALHRPHMIASTLFAAPYLEHQTKLDLVGLFGAFPRPAGRGTDLLLAIGCGGEAGAIAGKFVDELARRPPSPFPRVHVEPSLMPVDAPSWMVRATFTAEMYAAICAALCRPGVGVLTDLLLSGARPFMFFEPGNRELRDNASAVERVGLGVSAPDPQAAFELAACYAADADARAEHERMSRLLDRNGSAQAAELLIARLPVRAPA